ncbi:type II toxin-antitoxin system Phd/YefM family antitoxin [Gemmobacter lanyuensis]
MFESGDLLQSQGQTEGPGHAADVAEAKSRFAEIIAAAERGEEVVIVRRGTRRPFGPAFHTSANPARAAERGRQQGQHPRFLLS